jgi:DNA-binding NarL/FixJ family response regulator
MTIGLFRRRLAQRARYTITRRFDQPALAVLGYLPRTLRLRYRPKKIFDRHRVVELRSQGFFIRQIAQTLGLGLGTVSPHTKSLFQKYSPQKGRPALIASTLSRQELTT